MIIGNCILYFIAIFTIVVILTTGKRIPTFAGPYTIILRTATNETDEFKSTGKMWAKLFFSPPRPKQLQYTWGLFYSTVPISNDHRVEIRVSSRSNNQWKRNAFVFKFDKLCDTVKLHAPFILKTIFGDTKPKCPVPAVELQDVRNQTINPQFSAFPIMPYGRYLFTMAFIDKNGEAYAVIAIDGEAIPKL